MDAKEEKPHFDPVSFRRNLHREPELSGLEQQTAQSIAAQLEAFGLPVVRSIGGHGIVSVVDSGVSGETTLLRADFDALPIQEVNSHSHVSEIPGVMHACGHDGHTSTLLQVAQELSQSPPESGKVILLFQPAEETGTGAASMLKEKFVRELKVDNAFAYHNLPGFPLGQIVVKENTFACASSGVLIEMEGKTSHAARPEKGLSPAETMSEVIRYLEELPAQFPDCFTLVTVVHARLGEEAFGISPGYARVMATLRSECNTTFGQMRKATKLKTKELENKTGLKICISWHEPFSAAVNSRAHYLMVREEAEALGYSVHEPAEPMRWSEDFSEFLAKWNGALFCIGSGECHPELHNPDYDFPDDILPLASKLFLSLVRRLNGPLQNASG